jgi:hypothetical protein
MFHKNSAHILLAYRLTNPGGSAYDESFRW